MRLTLAAILYCALCSSPALAFNASLYGLGDGYYGKRTACGNIHKPGDTVAHKTLPCGTKVRITGPNGATRIVTVTDRGPFIKGRVWDLNSSLRYVLGCHGICNVKAVVLTDRDK